MREFAARDCKATAFAHRNIPGKLAEMECVRVVKVDMGDEDSTKRAFDEAASLGEIHAVVHCAGRASDVGRASAFKRANYDAVLNTATQAAKHDARFIFISTSDVLGITDFDNANESTPLPARYCSFYPRFKAIAEPRVAEICGDCGYVILRPSAVWGPGDNTIAPRIVKFLRTSPRVIHFGRHRGSNIWGLAYVGNVARAAYCAAFSQTATGRIYIVNDEEKTTVDEYYRMLARIFVPEKTAVKTLCLPRWIGLAIGAASSSLSWLFNTRQPVFDPSYYGCLHVSANLDFDGSACDAMMREMGVEQLTRKEAVEEYRSTELLKR